MDAVFALIHGSFACNENFLLTVRIDRDLVLIVEAVLLTVGEVLLNT